MTEIYTDKLPPCLPHCYARPTNRAEPSNEPSYCIKVASSTTIHCPSSLSNGPACRKQLCRNKQGFPSLIAVSCVSHGNQGCRILKFHLAHERKVNLPSHKCRWLQSSSSSFLSSTRPQKHHRLLSESTEGVASTAFRNAEVHHKVSKSQVLAIDLKPIEVFHHKSIWTSRFQVFTYAEWTILS